MTRTPARPLASRKPGTDLEAWLLGAPELDAGALTLLAAYRDLTAAARAAVPAPVAPPASPEGQTASDGTAPSPEPTPRAVPGIPRLRSVDGLDSERLGGLHGQLLAAGYLTAELLGRSDGLAYRITREGTGRLAGETATDIAEAA